MYVEPTNICNFSCSFCPESLDNYSHLAGGDHSMSFESWTRIAEGIEALCGIGGLRTLNFYMMGEPLANPSTPDFIRDARRRGLAHRISIT